MLTDMADRRALDSRVSPEGRVVIPAEVRRHLQVGAGDKVSFVVLEDGRVEIVTPRMLAAALWANNSGGEDIDSTEAVRELRSADQRTAALSEDAQDSPAETADEASATARLLTALGLAE